MSVITTNVSKMSLTEKLVKGQEIITKSSSNPEVPGNGPMLAAFVAVQSDLQTALNEEVAVRGTVTEKMTVREDALVAWVQGLNSLAGFTESATGGNAAKIESAGFGVRAKPAPPQALPAPINVEANTNGTPGHTLVTWKPLAGAKSYAVQISPDPITATSWALSTNCTKAAVDVNGAVAGQRYWYRVAGVNAKGQGPWSEPACRPVM